MNTPIDISNVVLKTDKRETQRGTVEENIINILYK